LEEEGWVGGSASRKSFCDGKYGNKHCAQAKEIDRQLIMK
jgi:hypothetical protein